VGRARTLKRLQQRMTAKVYETLAQVPAPPSKTYQQEDGQTFTHSEAPSVVWEPVTYLANESLPDGTIIEVWHNKWYNVSVRRYTSGFPVGGGPYVIVGLTHISERAVHDWRDMQCIKNDICGEEWEGVELYPAESRLIDPSNRFYLWCVPLGVLTWGLNIPGRRVLTMGESIAPQRPFPHESGTLVPVAAVGTATP
jgi:hypothetical protein